MKYILFNTDKVYRINQVQVMRDNTNHKEANGDIFYQLYILDLYEVYKNAINA